MSEVVEGQRPAMSYIPGWNEYIAWSREHRDYTGSLRSLDQYVERAKFST
eukprot:COSAG06_NODE_22283_length_728_cov_1.802862_1_plen_49_part_10